MESYIRRLGLETVIANVSGKIWAFVDEEYETTILIIDNVQQLTLKLFNWDLDIELVVTLVYAKCDRTERIELWDSLSYLASDITTPWLFGGDFNVIVDEEEKYGELPVSIAEVEDFRHCIQICNLTDLGYKGSIYTWWNGRGGDDCVFKRLDRCLGFFEWQELYPGLEVSHLIKNGSDHSHMLLAFKKEVQQYKKSFKFLNFWTKHESFMDVVKENWNTEVEGISFWRFNLKMKNMRKMLSTWSRSTYRGFFQKVTNMEEVIRAQEAMFEENPSFVNKEKLNKVNTEYTPVLAIEEEYWKQKAGMSWFQDGTRTPNSFMLKSMLEIDQEIAEEAVRFYLDQFHETAIPTEFDILQHVDPSINAKQDQMLVAMPIIQEVKDVVFGLNPTSAGGPDGYTVMKLDMTKAYDKLSWGFLTSVLRKIGFGENFIVHIWELVANNWYSVLINGQPHGFFHSTRGVKQGDPLLPTLFIIVAEVLSRALNSLHQNQGFCGFGMPKWSPRINHLCYADDTIIFASACEISLKMIMEVLADYEKASGQLINKAKSAVYLHDRVDEIEFQRVERITSIGRQAFPIIYIGCPIYYSRAKMAFYSALITRIRGKLQGWKGKLLSFGVRAVLFKHVRQTMPMHLLSAIYTPSFVENGLGFRSLNDMSLALFAKLWWNFRTKPSLWNAFMGNKYLKKNNSILVPWKQGSLV
ncbi:uncharacterized protein LOC132613164 [Lycium barbarum]|uniref:uncharacterized protein LOC132613164 n=1 Tax=Lycium barbarum TaxID=112863 RepID=UPI00293F6A05|nr:uncharacterized protein LOC132613164 [Lycium barbarum]